MNYFAAPHCYRLALAALGLVGLIMADRGHAQGGKKEGDKGNAVSAVVLSTAYLTDSAKADEKYKDKTLVIDGKVHDTDTLVGMVWVSLAGFQAKNQKAPETVICKMGAGYKEEMFKKGAMVKIQGKCKGVINGQVEVVECKLVK